MELAVRIAVVTGGAAGLALATGLMDTPAARRSGADLAQARPPEEVAAVIVELAADEESGGRVVTL